MGAPAIFEKQIEINLLHPASTLESRIQAGNSPGIMGEGVHSHRLAGSTNTMTSPLRRYKW
jgi:hypothetical protein